MLLTGIEDGASIGDCAISGWACIDVVVAWISYGMTNKYLVMIKKSM